MRKLIILIFLLSSVSSLTIYAHNNILRISDNRRFLQYEDGTPFFYLADTAWELFHRLDREEADLYLKDRAKKGFNAIQAVAIAELDGIDTPNAYGHLPFNDKDPLKPDIKDGEQNDYWDHVDYIVDRANSLGLFVAMLPSWGRYWHDENSKIFDPQNAFLYGKWLGERYKDSAIIWILGGDRNPDNENQKQIIRAMAKGLLEGDKGNHLITFHPTGWQGSGQFFHNEEWLDFNMRQNSHEVESTTYSKIAEDYNREPVKPVLDGEPLYEDHPVAFRPDDRGHSIAADVRRALYWDLFNGSCGHTYGHHSVWQMFDPEKREPVNRPLMSWKEALNQPGSSQMIYGKELILSRPYFSRKPATDEALKKDEYDSKMPGKGIYHFAATRDSEGTFIMIYAPTGRKFTVNTSLINDNKLNLWWFDPRTGKSKSAGCVTNKGEMSFMSPANGELQDWILVIDSKKAKYHKP